MPIEPIGAVGANKSQEEATVAELAKRDRAVRQHEEAHKAAAGQYASGGPTFRYVNGPDHKQYAVSGEVRLDVAPIADDPDATIRKMEQIKRAALAPADPSGQDYHVAANASAQEARALRQKTRAQGRPAVNKLA
jgi:hypothetical protein